MRTRERIVLAAAAVLVIAVAFAVLGRPGGDEETTGDPVATAPSVTSTGTGGTRAPADADEAGRARPDRRARPGSVLVRLAGGRPVGGVRTVRVRSGDTVRLRLTSDTAQVIHVHGYDREVRLPAAGSARLAFRADAEGIFDIEAHGTGQLLAKLEVRP